MPISISPLKARLWGAFGTTGQRCTATSRLIVHRDVAKKITDMLVGARQKIKIGDGLDESVEMGPLINQAARRKGVALYRHRQAEGARLLSGGSDLR